jgi:hypothetical protein
MKFSLPKQILYLLLTLTATGMSSVYASDSIQDEDDKKGTVGREASRHQELDLDKEEEWLYHNRLLFIGNLNQLKNATSRQEKDVIIERLNALWYRLYCGPFSAGGEEADPRSADLALLKGWWHYAITKHIQHAAAVQKELDACANHNVIHMKERHRDSVGDQLNMDLNDQYAQFQLRCQRGSILINTEGEQYKQLRTKMAKAEKWWKRVRVLKQVIAWVNSGRLQLTDLDRSCLPYFRMKQSLKDKKVILLAQCGLSPETGMDQVRQALLRFIDFSGSVDNDRPLRDNDHALPNEGKTCWQTLSTIFTPHPDDGYHPLDNEGGMELDNKKSEIENLVEWLCDEEEKRESAATASDAMSTDAMSTEKECEGSQDVTHAPAEVRLPAPNTVVDGRSLDCLKRLLGDDESVADIKRRLETWERYGTEVTWRMLKRLLGKDQYRGFISYLAAGQ